MSYSQTTSIVCAALAGLAVLIVIIVQVRQRILKRGNGLFSDETGDTEAAKPAAAPPAIVPAAGPVGVQAGLPVMAPPVGVQAGLPVMGTPTPPTIPETHPEEDDEPVTSLEIVTMLKGLPPVEAEAVKEKLLGSEVEWTLYYSSMLLKGASQIEVTLLNTGNEYPGVSFLVDMNQYPEFRNIQWGRPITVKGTISSIYSMYIILSDVTLTFPRSIKT